MRDLKYFRDCQEFDLGKPRRLIDLKVEIEDLIKKYGDQTMLAIDAGPDFYWTLISIQEDYQKMIQEEEAQLKRSEQALKRVSDRAHKTLLDSTEKELYLKLKEKYGDL